MLPLSELLGRRVVTLGGTPLGRVAEATIAEWDDESLEMLGLGRSSRVRRWVAWGHVVAVGADAVVVRDAAVPRDGVPVAPRPASVWLRRDVLDTQVLGETGTRLVRVGDVLLAGDESMRPVAVEVGLAPVVRRLGLRRAGTGMASSVIAWSDLQPASSLGVTNQLMSRPDALRRLRPHELATVISSVSVGSGAAVLQALAPEKAAAALGATTPGTSASLVHALPAQMAAAVVDAMAPDDAVAVLRRVPRRDVETLLGHIGSMRAEVLRRLLEHRADTAAGFMTTDVRTARPGEPLDEIRARLIADPPELGSLATVFVVDDDGHPIGVIDSVSLLIGRHSVQHVPAIPASLAVDAVLDLFATHDFLAVPVVDDVSGVLIGAIAVDDVLEELLAERLPGHHARFAHVGRRFRRVAPRARRRDTTNGGVA